MRIQTLIPPLMAVALAGTGTALAQGTWNPLSFPDRARSVAPAPPAVGESAVPPARRVSRTSATRPATGASRQRGESSAPPARGANPTRPSQLPDSLVAQNRAYQAYLREVHRVPPNAQRIAQAFQAYQEALQGSSSNADTSGVGLRSTGESSEDPPPTGGHPIVPPLSSRVVLQRVGSHSYDVFTGSGGQAEHKSYVEKALFGGLKHSVRYNVKDDQNNHEAIRGFQAKTRRSGIWQFFQTESRRGSSENTLLFEFRPDGDSGWDVYSRSGQLFARIKWESRQEGDQSVVQRVFYYHAEGQDTAQASVVSGSANGQTALFVRQGAGEGAVEKVRFVLQDWEAGAGSSSGGGLDFGGLIGGGREDAGPAADELQDVSAFIDAFVVDTSIDSVGWREVSGALTSFDFYDD